MGSRVLQPLELSTDEGMRSSRTGASNGTLTSLPCPAEEEDGMGHLGLGGFTAAVCGLLLLGCSNDSAASTPTPPTTTSSSTSPSSPSPTTTSDAPPSRAPQLPALAKEESIAGAKAFVRFYMQAINYSWHARNGALLRQHSTVRCVSCRGLARTMDDLRTNGGFSKGGDWLVTSASQTPLQPQDMPIIHTSITATRGSWRKSSTDHVRQIKPEKIYVDVHLRWVSGRWRVTSMVPG